MNNLQKAGNLIVHYMALFVLLCAVVALLFPNAFTWTHSIRIEWLLGLLMFGMGMTIKPMDLWYVISHPKEVMIGCVAQFTLMPLAAWLLCKIFSLPLDIAIGITLVGCVPGGTASNIITYLAKGDMALSVCMTSISTLLSPVLTPALTYLLIGEQVHVDVIKIFISIVQVVILPIGLGTMINRYFPVFAKTIQAYLPSISTLSLLLIITSIVSSHAFHIKEYGTILLGAVILHNLLGFFSGFALGKLLHWEMKKCSAVAIEVGMQNSGLAVSIASIHFAQYPLATVPGALFSVWHNLSGAIFAHFLRKRNEVV